MSEVAGIEVGLPEAPLEVGADWMTTVLRTSGAIDADTSVATISTEQFQLGVGVLGQLGRSVLTYEGGSGPDSVILKWPINAVTQRFMGDALNAYEREVRFYREIASECNLRTPKVHAAIISEDKTHSVIVMEDLSKLRQADRTNGVTWEEAVTAVRTLARFQAPWFGDERLEEMSKCWYSLQNPIYGVILPEFINAGWESCQKHGARYLNDELIAFGNEWVDYLPAMQAYLPENPTLIHADWRSDNMFFDENGEIVMIDFQIVGIGTGVYDLGYFICQSIEREVRQGRERELINIYVDELAKSGFDRSADQVWEDLRVVIGFCFIYGIVGFAEYETLPGDGQNVVDTLLRRSTQGIMDVGAIEAITSLPK